MVVSHRSKQQIERIEMQSNNYDPIADNNDPFLSESNNEAEDDSFRSDHPLLDRSNNETPPKDR